MRMCNRYEYDIFHNQQVLASDEGRELRARHQSNVLYLREKLTHEGIPAMHSPSHIIPIHVSGPGELVWHVIKGQRSKVKGQSREISQNSLWLCFLKTYSYIYYQTWYPSVYLLFGGTLLWNIFGQVYLIVKVSVKVFLKHWLCQCQILRNGLPVQARNYIPTCFLTDLTSSIVTCIYVKGQGHLSCYFEKCL